MRHTLLLLLLGAMVCTPMQAQIVINEASNRNASQTADEDGDFGDWLELYNAGVGSVNLEDFGLSDDPSDPLMWTLPDITLDPGAFLLIYASGKDRKPDGGIDHWEGVVTSSTSWKYRVPNALTPTDWREIGFDAASWSSGLSSIGYGDGDDATTVPAGTVSVFMRYEFTITDTSRVADAFFHMDWDDGFVAYLNGTQIAQFGFPGGTPDYNDFSGSDHEAVMYGGGLPDAWALDEAWLKTMLVEGENVLAVEVHNINSGSSDLTSRPFLTVGFKDADWTFDVPEIWFTEGSFANNLHTNFKLDGDGEVVFLSYPDGSPADSLSVPAMFYDQSFGCSTDGAATHGIFIDATPGYTNNGSSVYTGYTPEPAFSLEAGFYTGTQSTEITCPVPGMSIRYTLDGQTPTPSDLLYSGPVEMDETTTVRAACFSTDPGLLPGRVATHTYFIDEETELAVISITTDDVNLYGGQGIYDNWWTDWKKPCFLEYFNEEHEAVVGQYSGIKLEGGAGGSRSLPQKSFRLEPGSGAYGDGVINYPLIPRVPASDTYDRFYLRNGSNMWNVLPYKDACMTRCTQGSHTEFMQYTPVEVWLNGEYWGLYELREKLDAGHFQYTHLIEPENLDLLSMSYWYSLILRTLEGSADEWMEMVDYLYYYPTPTDDDFWEVADSLLNLVDFTDYMIAETWMGNLDWPWNNIKIYRDRGGDNQWKYGVIDLEWGLGYGWSDESTDMIANILYNYNYYTSPFLSLIQNERYRNYFINRYADLMNTIYLPERTLAVEDSIYDVVVTAMPRQLQRWGDGSPLWSQMATFEDYRGALLDDFEVRSLYVRNHIWNNFDLDGKVDIEIHIEPPGAGRVHLNTIDIYDPAWEGVYFDGVPVTMTAIPFTGYSFDHWGDSPYIDDESLPSFTVNFDDDDIVTAYFNGSPQPETIVVSEVNYHSEETVDAGDWFELWNHGDHPIYLDNWMVRDDEPLHAFYFPYHTTLMPGERLVVSADPAQFQLMHPDVAVIGPCGFQLSNDGDMIQLFNDRGDEVFVMTFSDNLPWPVGADGEGRTLELSTADADPNLPASWFDGCIGGSPGAAYEPCGDPIVYSEVNYHPADDHDSDDWVELRNVSEESVDLSGWTFLTGRISMLEAFTIPNGTILEPGDHYLLTQTDWKFEGLYLDVTADDGSFFFDLDGGNEWLRMYDNSGVLQMSLHYFDESPWPLEADGLGYTLELIDSTGVVNDAANWTTGCLYGSPGTWMSLPCPESVAIDDPVAAGFHVYPNPAHDLVWIVLPYAAHWQCTLTDLQGRIIGVAKLSGQNGNWQLPELNPGTYTLTIANDGEAFTRLLLIQ